MVISSSLEPIHILGAGSVGKLWAALIRSKLPSYPVTLLVRDHHLSKVNNIDQCDITLKRLYPQIATDQLSVPVQSVSDTSSIQTLIVATKAYQAKQAVETVKHRLSKESSKIIVLSNGALSVKDELVKFNIPLVLATTTHGAYTEKNLQIVHAGVGKTFVEDCVAELSSVWDSVGLRCTPLSSRDMSSTLWQKLAANCVINPLTALYKCTNGELLMEPSFPVLCKEIINELVQVAEASNQNDVSEESLTKFVYQVIQDTKNNKSSMYQDILRKQQTEIDHLNGFIVRKAKDNGIDCSANEEICFRIRELQKQ
jgi:2-dehydropantoate 2-reductase